MVWNTEVAEPITTLTGHPDTVFSIAWGRDGALICTTCKDKKLRILDPRSGGIVMVILLSACDEFLQDTWFPRLFIN